MQLSTNRIQFLHFFLLFLANQILRRIETLSRDSANPLVKSYKIRIILFDLCEYLHTKSKLYFIIYLDYNIRYRLYYILYSYIFVALHYLD